MIMVYNTCYFTSIVYVIIVLFTSIVYGKKRPELMSTLDCGRRKHRLHGTRTTKRSLLLDTGQMFRQADWQRLELFTE